ncbi:hypothetical protein DFH06DRAFT_1321185 [Mycena polygramma]|nr:hypothetical protein DFH06DRAFT_1321185 [Mycena polygramma]
MNPFLAAYRARVNELDAQIREVQRTLSALRTEKASALEQLAAYKYPVLTLPNEIVSEIFSHFVPPASSPPPLRGDLSPTILTTICKKWGRIALTTPALWKAITFSGFHSEDLRKLLRWLSRSRSSPLSLKVRGKFNLSQIFSAIVAHRARWERLDCNMCSSHLSSMGDGPTPLLRHLALVVDEKRPLNNPTPPTATFRDAPMLRTAVLSSFAAANLILPWSQLTSLTLVRITPEEWVPVLEQTTNLVHCGLEIVIPDDDFVLPTEVKLLRLETLTVTVADEIEGCLEAFVVPALRRLEVPEAFLYPDPITTLTSFMSKSSCRLRELHITDERSVPMDSYLWTFESIPRLYFEYKDREEPRARSVELRTKTFTGVIIIIP